MCGLRRAAAGRIQEAIKRILKIITTGGDAVLCRFFYLYSLLPRETAHTTTLIAVTAANSTAIQRIVATFLSGRNHFGEGSGCEG